MQCKYASPHIAVYVLLAGGQPLVAAPLFAVNASGGLNCTKVLTFKCSLCEICSASPWSALIQVLHVKEVRVVHLYLTRKGLSC